jgi:hypothetical protein
MHAARMMMNRNPSLRAWVEQRLKARERTAYTIMSDEEFETHWKSVKPERMHEGALEAVTAYTQQNAKR